MADQREAPKAGQTPPVFLSLLSGSRLVLAGGVAALTPWSDDNAWAIVLATGIIALGELTDLADGLIARKTDNVSEFGKLLDPFVDGAAHLVYFWSLAVNGRCLDVVPLVLALRYILVASLYRVLMAQGRELSARWWGKAASVMLAAGALSLMSGPLWWGQLGPWMIWTISGLVLVSTVVSGLLYARLVL